GRDQPEPDREDADARRRRRVQDERALGNRPDAPGAPRRAGEKLQSARQRARRRRHRTPRGQHSAGYSNRSRARDRQVSERSETKKSPGGDSSGSSENYVAVQRRPAGGD